MPEKKYSTAAPGVYWAYSGPQTPVFECEKSFMFSITFQNPFGNAIELEIRTGSQASCSANAVAFSGPLGPNASFPLDTSDNVVCYRRTASPGTPGSGFGGFITFSPDDINTPVTIQL